eukprot:353588-Chlamydomonas_euryale.AAC.12
MSMPMPNSRYSAGAPQPRRLAALGGVVSRGEASWCSMRDLPASFKPAVSSLPEPGKIWCSLA